jgi:hypothetical protein
VKTVGSQKDYHFSKHGRPDLGKVVSNDGTTSDLYLPNNITQQFAVVPEFLLDPVCTVTTYV